MVKSRFVTGAVAAAALTLFAAPVSAQQVQEGARTPDVRGGEPGTSIQERLQMWDETEYERLHMALVAYEQCRGSLSESEIRTLISRIEALSGEPASPALKLSVQDAAQSDMEDIVIVEGCADDRVKQALAIFDQRLAPALQGGTAITERPQ